MRKLCPNCNKFYDTALDRPYGDNRNIQEIFPNATKVEREQLISGICSDICWHEFLGIPMKDYTLSEND